MVCSVSGEQVDLVQAGHVCGVAPICGLSEATIADVIAESECCEVLALTVSLSDTTLICMYSPV